MARLEDALARAEVARVSAEAALATSLAAKAVEMDRVTAARDAAQAQLSEARARAIDLERANQAMLADREVMCVHMPLAFHPGPLQLALHN